MKIVIVGARGAVGNTAVEALSVRHEIITVGKTSGDVQVDLEDIASIRAMYERIGKCDAMVCAVGHGHFGPPPARHAHGESGCLTYQKAGRWADKTPPLMR